MNIRWGKYKQFQGPWYPGDAGFTAPPSPTLEDQIMAVITATEGGSWNAINMYDRCVCTAGLIQWCEAKQYSVSAMIQAALLSGADASPLRPAMAASGVEFEAGRFRWRGGPKKVEGLKEQQRLFLLRSDGETWDEGSKAHAKLWVRALADFLRQPVAIEAQKRFTAARLFKWFVFGAVPKDWIKFAREDGSPGASAFVCGYLSFAANNPTWAKSSLERGVEDARGRDPFGNEWLSIVFEHLTFDPGVSIYPHRYDKIRPVLEREFGVDLPDFSKDLKAADADELLMDVDKIQAILLELGYDLGVSGPEENGVDGVWGGKTEAALKEFEQKAGLPVDGRSDPRVNAALLSAANALG